MKSRIMQKDHEQLRTIQRELAPEERLRAFSNHSRLMALLRKSGEETLSHPEKNK